MAAQDLIQDPLGEALAADAQGAKISTGQWMALAAALLGWMFDGAEMGVFSMVGRSALQDLLPDSSEAQVQLWFGIVTAGFLVGAATGGVLFGWLGDRIGRVRAMTLSVLVYALFTGFCGMATTGWQLGVLRFIAALGMGGEWSLGVALVMEVWPNRSRAFMAGLIGAAANVGYLLVGAVGLGLATILVDLTELLNTLGVPPAWNEWLMHNHGWRIMMVFGTTPALLTFLIRLFVPESEKWQHEQATGATSNWVSRDLLGVLVGACGPGLMIYLWAFEHSTAVRLLGSLFGLLLATAGYTYPVLRYLQRNVADGRADARDWKPTFRRMFLAAGLSGVALLATWGSAQWAPTWADKLTASNPELGAKYYTQMVTAFGAIIGTIVAAMMGDWFGRRMTYTLLCLVALGSLLLFYQGNTQYGPFFLFSALLAGGCTASFYGWLPLYLPELFHTNVRATGQGFGFNFGRILAAVGALQTGNLFAKEVHIGSWTLEGGYPFACSAMSLIYLVGVVLIWFAPETRGQPLPD